MRSETVDSRTNYCTLNTIQFFDKLKSINTNIFKDEVLFN